MGLTEALRGREAGNRMVKKIRMTQGSVVGLTQAPRGRKEERDDYKDEYHTRWRGESDTDAEKGGERREENG